MSCNEFLPSPTAEPDTNSGGGPLIVGRGHKIRHYEVSYCNVLGPCQGWLVMLSAAVFFF